MGCSNDPNSTGRFPQTQLSGFSVATGSHPLLYANIDPAWRRRAGTIRHFPLVRAVESNSAYEIENIIDSAIALSPNVAHLRTSSMAAVEAALFASTEPLTLSRLAKLADLQDTGEARKVIQQLNEALDADASAFRIEEIAGGFQLLTRVEMTEWLKRMSPRQVEPQLSPSTLEVLAIVAYRQPICRADIEAIRGVQVPEILKQLLDRGLLRLSGRDESLGRPFLYGTTRKFLDAFGLRSLRELPLVDLLVRPPEVPSEPVEARPN